MADATLRQLFLNDLVQGCVLGLAALALLAAAPRLWRRYAPQWFGRVWVVLCAAPAWLTDPTPLPEEEAAQSAELTTRLQDCLYLNRCTTGDPVVLAWEKTADGWQPATPGTPNTLEGVYAKAAEGLTADSVQAGLNCTMTDAARQELFPDWDGPVPMLTEQDGQLYIRCERAADLNGSAGWMNAGFRYGSGTGAGNGAGNGYGYGNGNGNGSGAGNGDTRRLRLQDGSGACLDLNMRRDGGCWLLDSTEEATE